VSLSLTALVTLPFQDASYIQMPSAASTRLVVAASMLVAPLLSAQLQPAPQAKPSAAQVTSTLPVTPATAAPTPAPLLPSQQPPKHAQVTFANGSLSVAAENSSLNQILRQISSETGIKISGGVVDERVFGHYGPDTPTQILSELLDGTGSNVFLTRPDGGAAPELILTPRQGGPTPPNPNAPAFDDKDDRPDVRESASPAPTASTPVHPQQPGPLYPSGVPAPTGASPSDASQPDSPNGVKSPQQIYEQLQRMRQQQPQSAPQ
jgi:hypothetical protein